MLFDLLLIAQTSTDTISEWGPFGILAAAIAADKSLYWIRGRNSAEKAEERLHERLDRFQDTLASITKTVEITQSKTRELHDWHKPDTSGEQSWKNKHLSESIDKVSDAVQSISRTVDRLCPILEKLETRLLGVSHG